jgi:hypothetical protein
MQEASRKSLLGVLRIAETGYMKTNCPGMSNLSSLVIALLVASTAALPFQICSDKEESVGVEYDCIHEKKGLAMRMVRVCYSISARNSTYDCAHSLHGLSSSCL